jgi:hypothetical protein
MASMIDYVIAWREMARIQKEKRLKDAMYKVLVGTELNYAIIKDLVTAARNDVVIDIELRDGSRLHIRPSKPLDVERPPKSEDY